MLNAVTGLAAWIAALTGFNPLTVGILYAISYTTGGYFGVIASIKALKEKTLNVDLLMLLAAL